jgi:tetratricopeptide (TPR) repeat protein
VGAFERATGIDPDYADAWYNKGIALGKLGRLEEALTAFERVIEIDPHHADASDISKKLRVLLSGKRESTE